MIPAARRPPVLRGIPEAMEERSFTVLVRYCGGCNPEIDRASIVNRLKATFEEVGIQVTFRKDPPADRLILVNGCPRACLEEEYQGKTDLTRFVSVEGSNLDHRPVPVDDLPRAILEKILEPVGTKAEA